MVVVIMSVLIWQRLVSFFLFQIDQALMRPQRGYGKSQPNPKNCSFGKTVHDGRVDGVRSFGAQRLMTTRTPGRRRRLDHERKVSDLVGPDSRMALADEYAMPSFGSITTDVSV